MVIFISQQVVELTKTTANRDKTEGLFDGVMQIAVCKVNIKIFKYLTIRSWSGQCLCKKQEKSRVSYNMFI